MNNDAWENFVKRYDDARSNSTRKASRKVARKASRKASRKVARKASRKVARKICMKKESCQDCLKRKIGINMREYKSGRFSSPKQAVAVSYSEVRNSRPGCKRVLSRR